MSCCRLFLFALLLRPLAGQSPNMDAALASQRASIARQAESVRRQTGAATPAHDGFFILQADATASATAGSPTPPCPALTDFQLKPLIDGAATANGVSTDLLRAVIQQESASSPCAVSPKGAQGLMQLMPATASQFSVSDPFDPKENIDAGAKLLSQLMKRYSGDLNRVLGAYNAGTSNVDAVNGIPLFPETQNYVRSILKNLQPAEEP